MAECAKLQLDSITASLGGMKITESYADLISPKKQEKEISCEDIVAKVIHEAGLEVVK